MDLVCVWEKRYTQQQHIAWIPDEPYIEVKVFCFNPIIIYSPTSKPPIIKSHCRHLFYIFFLQVFCSVVLIPALFLSSHIHTHHNHIQSQPFHLQHLRQLKTLLCIKAILIILTGNYDWLCLLHNKPLLQTTLSAYLFLYACV